MNVLWFVNISLPPVLERMGQKPGGSGWWLVALAAELAREPSVILTIVNCSHHYSLLDEFEAGGVTYVTVPVPRREINGWVTRPFIRKLSALVNERSPDVVEVRGTEFPYGLVASAIHCPVVVNIQLFISEVADRPYGRSSWLRALALQTRRLADLKAVPGCVYSRLGIARRSHVEKRIFNSNRYFVGRTDWDRGEMAKMASPGHQYHCCWEIMRPQFYSAEWSSATASVNVLFACSRCAPGKGYDDLIRMLAFLKPEFPDLVLRLAGDKGERGWGGYLRRLAHQLGVGNSVQFLGYLTADQIADELRCASVYVMASYLENSPNSLGEAMCVGVPCVASTTGGIASMIEDGQNGLLFETGNLRQGMSQIARVLKDREFAEKLGRNARQVARVRHDPQAICRRTLEIYRSVIVDWSSRRCEL